jgi:TetR/AcrR family transcriptional regulator, regulator of biofilm formation and stress response
MTQAATRRRGIERRQRLLEATLRVLAREGPRAVTHRNVAEEAGVPLAATTYYFSSKDELLKEAFRFHAANELRRVENAIGEFGNSLSADDLAMYLAKFLADGLHESRQSLLAEYALLLEAAHDAQLEEFARQFYDAFADWLTAILEKLGSKSPAVDVRIILATLAGLEVDNLATPSTALDRAELESLTRRLVIALLAESPHPDGRAVTAR